MEKCDRGVLGGAASLQEPLPGGVRSARRRGGGEPLRCRILVVAKRTVVTGKVEGTRAPLVFLHELDVEPCWVLHEEEADLLFFFDFE